MKTSSFKWKNRLKKWLKKTLPEKSAVGNVEAETQAPLLIRALGREKLSRALIVVPQLDEAERLGSSLRAWSEFAGIETEAQLLPEMVSGSGYSPESEAERMRVLSSIALEKPGPYIASCAAFTAAVPARKRLKSSRIEFRTGHRMPMPGITALLLEMDYDDEDQVSSPGEFACRGGIIDVFSTVRKKPARIEFWGDEITSIRLFSPDTQRSAENVESYEVAPRLTRLEEDRESLLADIFFPDMTPFILIWPGACLEHLERFGTDCDVHKWRGFTDKIPFSRWHIFLDPVETSSFGEHVPSACVSPAEQIRKNVSEELDSSVSRYLRQMLANQISRWTESGCRVALAGGSSRSREAIGNWCREFDIDAKRIIIDTAELPHGIYIPEIKLAVLTERELYATLHRSNPPVLRGIKDQVETGDPSALVDSFADIEPGTHVVHHKYGIALFRGMDESGEDGLVSEEMLLEFADEVVLSVPLWQSDIVSRYIGTGKTIPKLSRLGEKRWSKSRKLASDSVREMAVELLRMEADRGRTKGCAFPEDGKEQKFFDSSFPFRDTPDQERAAEEIRSDMTSSHPMDRLLCGDAGYGKTELAARAAFRSVMAGRQVAFLVPTTVLAQQHCYTFRERFSEYPVIIEMLSRFRTPAEQKKILDNVRGGKVDIVIGTHRLIQKDVKFKDIGLLIIDEEQRFGVAHKEKLKRLRSTVDVLTMTATPIPRTLYMALSGLRNLSTIMTPPDLRLPVKTEIAQFDIKLVKSAIEREVARGGQVFFLHNRVKTIQQRCREIHLAVPEAVCETAHGQMNEHELEEVMARFIDGKIDVLVCTTIIESGIDVPNANTIIIERADRFGLAELYQLRGRVGRWNRQAYSYLLLPRRGVLTGDVRKRIVAVRKYTQLGAGFRLALRDLEIRGAGNLLGREQSGHINAVGFHFYCRMLKSAVSGQDNRISPLELRPEMTLDFVDFASGRRKGRVSAAIPREYIPSELLRIDSYKRLASARSAGELDKIRAELSDRFGKLPEPLENLYRIYRIRIEMASSGFHSLRTKNKQIRIRSEDGFIFKDGRIPLFSSGDPDKKLDELERAVFDAGRESA